MKCFCSSILALMLWLASSLSSSIASPQLSTTGSDPVVDQPHKEPLPTTPDCVLPLLHAIVHAEALICHLGYWLLALLTSPTAMYSSSVSSFCHRLTFPSCVKNSNRMNIRIASMRGVSFERAENSTMPLP